MPKISTLKLPPLALGNETIGQRLQHFRKIKGYTQKELAEKIGIIQALVSAYERNKIRLHPEMLIRFSLALNVSADFILGLKQTKKNNNKISLKVIRRLKKIEKLSPSKQKVLFTTIDNFLKAEGK